MQCPHPVQGLYVLGCWETMDRGLEYDVLCSVSNNSAKGGSGKINYELSLGHKTAEKGAVEVDP